MKTIFLRKTLSIVPFLIFSTGYSMQEDPTENTIITPSNITLGTTSVLQPSTFVKVTFPAEQEKLRTEITQGSSHIHIYIPNDSSSQPHQKIVDFPRHDSSSLTNIRSLIIQHSLRSDRGYSKPALAVLIPLLKNAQNLEEVTLSQALADDLIPCLRVGVRVFLDCFCSYSNNDTMHPKEYLIGLRNSILAYYQEIYPKSLGFRIDALEIPDVFVSPYK